MQNNRLSDVNSKSGSELIAIAHGIAANFESPATELLRELASRLECAIIRGDELQQKLDSMAAENAALKSGAKYFMYGPDCGFEHYNSQDEALKAANEMIGDYRENAADGWCDEVDQVCFGIVLSYSLQHDVKPPSEYNDFLGSVDYVMKAPETPATDAYLNSVRAEGVEMLAAAYEQSAKEVSDYKVVNKCRIKAAQATEFAGQLRSVPHDTADKAG